MVVHYRLLWWQTLIGIGPRDRYYAIVELVVVVIVILLLRPSGVNRLKGEAVRMKVHYENGTRIFGYLRLGSDFSSTNSELGRYDINDFNH